MLTKEIMISLHKHDHRSEWPVNDKRHMHPSPDRSKIGSTTQAVVTVRNLDNGYGCFGRDAADLSEPVTIRHDIADDKFAKRSDDLGKLAGTRVVRSAALAAGALTLASRSRPIGPSDTQASPD